MAEYQIGISDSEKCPQFFKLYMPAHCSTQLRIPPAFIKYFEGCLPLKFILVTSARKSWEVDMNKIDNDVYFKSGWEKFVQDNLLEFGDFLIFYYNGGSKFCVSIFGRNNCSKENEVANNESEKQPTNIQWNETNAIDELAGTRKEISVEDSKLSFEVMILQTYLSRGYLETGRVFSGGVKEYRPIAKLQHSGRTWDVKVVPCRNVYRFINGWGSFVRDNCLAFGDVCSFKLVDIKPEFYLLNVSIYRVL